MGDYACWQVVGIRPARRQRVRQKEPLRTVSEDEQTVLIHLSRSAREAAAVVARAKALLAVADGASYRAAAQVAGRRSGDAVARLVARFNGQGLKALVPQHDGGRQAVYTSAERERILREARASRNTSVMGWLPGPWSPCSEPYAALPMDCPR
jgi:hypothetical protein